MFERGTIQERAAIDDVVVDFADFASFAGLILLLGKIFFVMSDGLWRGGGRHGLNSFVIIFHS